MAFSMKMLKLLQSFEIKPICIFDGRHHEGKVDCEKKRSENKKKNLELAKKFEKEGNYLEAKKYYQRCMFIKSKQIDLFQEILKAMEIEHYNAPYEANA